MLLDPVLVHGDEVLPTLGGKLRHPIEPERVQFGTLVVLQEIFVRDAVTLGEPH